jgi:hypothetical protein
MLDDITHVIQVALTPVFLLSAIGALLNVFSTRLGRVSDRVDVLAQQISKADPGEARNLGAQLAYLRRRSKLLDVAVVLAALGGGFTCLAAGILFVGALRDSTVVSALFASFGLSIGCTMVAIVAFVVELLLASRGLREEVQVREDQAASQLVQPADRERLTRAASPPPPAQL